VALEAPDASAEHHDLNAPSSESRSNVRALVAFFVLAYSLSWAWVIPWAATGHTVYQGQGWPTHLPSLLGPMLAAFIVTWWTAGRTGLRDLVARMGRWRIGWRWWLVALSPIAFFAVGLAVAAVTKTGLPTALDFARFSGLPSGIGVVLVALTVIAVNGYGEETGWRGYAQPQLQTRFTPLTATLILAGIWAGWHIPQFFFLHSYESFSVPMLPIFVVGLACGAVVLTWLYNWSGGSILAVVIWHGLYNVSGATKAATEGSGTISAVVWTLVVFQGLALVALELRALRRGTSILRPP